MATLRDIKRRIKGVQNTQQITKAMKMVAAAKLRRAQDNVINARPYAKHISVLLKHLVSEEDIASNPFIAQREIKNTTYVVVTADRGLCGAFSTNILREASRFINEEVISTNTNSSVFCIGKKGYDFFKNRSFNLTGNKSGLFTSLKYEYGLSIVDELSKSYLDGKVDKIYVIYNEFKSIIQQRIITEQLLPIPVQQNFSEETPADPNYIFEPDQKSIFEYLLPKHLNAQMWRILLESFAAEQAARMTAMDNATTNAKEMIRTLQLKYNRERQAAITKEILEIVSGANALKGT